MKHLFRIIVVVLVLMPTFLFAQHGVGGKRIEQKGSFLRQLQPRDSVLVADQLEYGFKVEGIPAGTAIGLPEYTDQLMDSVEIVSSWQLDTVKAPRGKKFKNGPFDIEGHIVITSFDEGVYELPSIFMLRQAADGTVDTLVFDPQILDVKTMPVDTTTYVIHDIKGQIKYPITFSEVLPYIIGVLLFAALVALVVYLVVKKRKAQKEAEEAEPAYIVALRKLEKFRGEKFWAPEKQKMFYSGITDALREYIVDRYGVEAMEMTTAEIFSGLKDTDIPKDLYLEMKTLFETADFVKFAKHLATNEENAAAVPSAVRFVTATYQNETPSEEPQNGPTDGDNTKVDDQKDQTPEEKDYSAYMPK